MFPVNELHLSSSLTTSVLLNPFLSNLTLKLHGRLCSTEFFILFRKTDDKMLAINLFSIWTSSAPELLYMKPSKQKQMKTDVINIIKWENNV